LVPSNEQIVGPLYPKHLHPDQYRRNDDRVHAVYTNAVHALKPGQCVALFVYEARIRANLRDRSARFDSTKHVLLRQVLMLD
jgi:hypothetical protein